MYRSCPGTTVARSQRDSVMVHLLLAALHYNQAIYFLIYVEHIRLNKQQWDASVDRQKSPFERVTRK